MNKFSLTIDLVYDAPVNEEAFTVENFPIDILSWAAVHLTLLAHLELAVCFGNSLTHPVLLITNDFILSAPDINYVNLIVYTDNTFT